MSASLLQIIMIKVEQILFLLCCLKGTTLMWRAKCAYFEGLELAEPSNTGRLLRASFHVVNYQTKKKLGWEGRDPRDLIYMKVGLFGNKKAPS